MESGQTNSAGIIGCRQVLVTLAASIVLIGLGLTRHHLSGEMRFRVPVKVTEASDPQVFDHSYPFLFFWKKGVLRLELEIDDYRERASVFWFHVDDCIEELRFNGRLVEELEYPVCIYPNAVPVTFEGVEWRNKNTLSLHIGNNVGLIGFGLSAGSSPFQLLCLRVGFLASIALLGAFVLWWFPFRSSYGRVFGVVFVLGVILRIFYFWETDWNERGYDMRGHLEYFSVLRENGRIPNLYGGFQFYQPPLYYAAGVLFDAILNALPFTRGYSAAQTLSLLSLLFSFGSLAIGLFILLVALQSFRSPRLYLLAASTFAFFPGLILQAPRVNNDTICNFLLIAGFAVVFLWWRSRRQTLWYFSVCLFSLGCLAKSTAVAGLPVPFILLLLSTHRSLRNMLITGFLGLLIVAGVNGSYAKLRLLQGQSHMVGNLDRNNPHIIVQDDAWSFIAYNPLKVMKNVYVNNWEDERRRRFMWEYLVRSSLFGEFHYEKYMYWLAFSMLLCLQVVLVLSVIGVGSALRSEFVYDLPIFTFAICGLGAFLAARLITPIGGMADFRYLPILALPLAYFSVRGIQALNRSMRMVAATSLGLFAVLSAVFIVVLGFEPVRVSLAG